MTILHDITCRTRHVIIFAVLLSLSTGCGKEEEPPLSRGIFRELVTEAVGLYTKIHPLRSSRLGIPGADSLLFTFSSEEIEGATSGLDSILAGISSLPASHFEKSGLDDSAALIGWLRGEIYALREVRLFRSNPLLYCWIIEEALYSIPSRMTPPEEDEFESYERRLSKIPGLLGNATSLLENPAETFISPSYESLTEILSDFDRIRSLAEKRYGRIPPSLEVARTSIETFVDFLLHDLEARARGRFILGVEVLSDILGFTEGLDIDLEKTAADAEKSLRKYMSQVNSIQRNPAFTESSSTREESPDLDTMIDSIETMTGDRKLFEDLDDFRAPVVRRQPPPLQTILPANPYLMIPVRKPGDMTSDTGSMFAGGECGSRITLAPGVERMDTFSNWYGLMGVSSAVTGIQRRICRDNRTIPSLLISELFLLSWERLNLKEMITIDDGMKMNLRKIHLQRKIRDITLMIVVFRIHSGIFDLDSATAFVTRSIGIPSDEARQHVALAASSPSLAMPGLAAFLGDRMVQKASTVRGERRPRVRVRRVMVENRGRPVGLILERVDR